MQQYTIPKDFTQVVESVPGLPMVNIRQGLYVIVGLLVGFIAGFYLSARFDGIYRIASFLLPVMTAVLLGWVKPYGIGLIDWAILVTRFLRKPRAYVWLQKPPTAAELGYAGRAPRIRPSGGWDGER